MLKRVLFVMFLLVNVGAWAQEDHLVKLFEVHSKFAALGSAEAQFKLGQMYEEGQGTKADIAKAREWYGKAAAQGYDKAKLRLKELDAMAAKAGSDAAAAQKRAEEEKARQEAAAAAQKRAEEEKARQEAAAKRAAEEEKVRQEAAAKRAAEEKARQEAAAKRAAEDKARQEAAAKRAAEEKARQEAAVAAQKRAEEEKARQEAAAAAQKRAEEEKARQTAAPKAEAPAATPSQTESFESDPCNTPAARFMSTCRDKK